MTVENLQDIRNKGEEKYRNITGLISFKGGEHLSRKTYNTFIMCFRKPIFLCAPPEYIYSVEHN